MLLSLAVWSPMLVRRVQTEASDSQTGSPFSWSPSRERTLEVRCGNCQARFVACYGTDEDPTTRLSTCEKCGCGGDSFKKYVFKDTVIRLIAQVTARAVKRE